MTTTGNRRERGVGPSQDGFVDLSRLIVTPEGSSCRPSWLAVPTGGVSPSFRDPPVQAVSSPRRTTGPTRCVEGFLCLSCRALTFPEKLNTTTQTVTVRTPTVDYTGLLGEARTLGLSFPNSCTPKRLRPPGFPGQSTHNRPDPRRPSESETTGEGEGWKQGPYHRHGLVGSPSPDQRLVRTSRSVSGRVGSIHRLWVSLLL